jgi:hypothetical protein
MYSGGNNWKDLHICMLEQVPTVEVALDEVEGDWFLVEYVNSHDGKPIGAHTPYLCPEVAPF